MTKKKPFNLGCISEEEVLEISNEIKTFALTSRNLVFVYSFPHLGQAAKKRLIRTGKQQRPLKKSNLHVNGNRKKSAVTSLKDYTKWAVWIEGKSIPEKKNFDTKERAVKYAEQLVYKGKAKRIAVEL